VLAWHQEVPAGVTARPAGLGATLGNGTTTASSFCPFCLPQQERRLLPCPTAQGPGPHGVGFAWEMGSSGRKSAVGAGGTGGGLGGALGLMNNRNKVLFLPK